MLVLVAGFDGYIAKRLYKHMKSKKIDVIGLSRQENLFRLAGDPLGDDKFLGRFEDILTKIKSIGLKVDYMVNLAAETTKESDFLSIRNLCDSNMTFNALLGKLAIDIGVEKFVYVSTYSISTNGKNYSPQTFYAATKYAGGKLLDYFAIDNGLNVVRLHFYDIYGPGHHSDRLITKLFNAMLNGQPLSLSQGEQEMAPLFIEDACEAILKSFSLNDDKHLHDYSIKGPEILRVKQIPTVMEVAFEKKWRANQLKFDKPYRSNEIMIVSPIFLSLPNWAAKYSLVEGIHAMVEELKSRDNQ
jgi:nucleoside-diphosphate-sugar epimerase